jgi:ATP-dependent 26S proteasome regulatory subunit
MSLADDVDLEEYVMAKDDLSGADIKAICTEAGLMALRERRMRVNKADFGTAREKVRKFLLAFGFCANVVWSGTVPEDRGHA